MHAGIHTVLGHHYFHVTTSPWMESIHGGNMEVTMHVHGLHGQVDEWKLVYII